jgi:hypothetical protein
MDPVNKWLLTVIIFMAAMLGLLWNVAGAGRYEMTVVASTGNYATVYVLDTKDGEVKAQVLDEADLYNGSKPYARPQDVFEWPSSSTYRRY